MTRAPLPTSPADFPAWITATMAEAAAEVAARRDRAAHAAGHPALVGLPIGAPVTFTDDHGRTRRGTYRGMVERVRSQGRGRRMLVVGYGIDVQALDGEVYRLPAATSTVTPGAAPVLPECSAFVGAGQRCSACRVHRRTHA